MVQIILDTPLQKEFYKNFLFLTRRQDRRKVWNDFIEMTRRCLDIHTLPVYEPFPTHMTEFYHDDEWACFGRVFDLTIKSLSRYTKQDFLGELYMRLQLSDSSRGEDFTPYMLCRAVSGLTLKSIEAEILKNGWATVRDPACGAGATLIALAEECSKRGIDYQKHVLFVAQDIGWTTASMCFIQLSLLGCGGYVLVGDTLATQLASTHPLLPRQQEGQQIWYTPLYYRSPWSDRVRISIMEQAIQCRERDLNDKNCKKTTCRPPKNYES